MNSKESINKSYNPIYLVNILLFILSASIGIYYFVLSLGYSDRLYPIIVQTVSLASIIIFSPDLIKIVLDRISTTTNGRWFTSSIFITILVLGLVIFIGFLLPYQSFNMSTYLIYIALPLLLISLAFYFYYFYPIDIFYCSLFVLFSLFIGSVTWKNGWQGPMFTEQLSIMSLSEIDVLFHSAVIGVIKTHGLPSTGLDGIPYLPYHWGSHWIFAQFSNILNMNGLLFCNLGFPLIIIPLYIKSIFYGVFSIRRYKKFDINVNSLLLLLLIVPIIHFTSEVTTVPIDNYSYVMSLMLSFLLFSLCIEYLNDKQKKINDRIIDYILLMFFIPLFIGLIALVKISVPFIILGVYLFLTLRLRLYKNYIVILSFLLSSIIFITIFLVTTDILVTHGSNIGISTVLSSLVKYGRLSFILNYIGIVVFIYFFLRRKKVTTMEELKNMIGSKQYIFELEILPCILIISLIPGLIGMNAGGSDFYFYNFQYWLSVIFILGYLPYLFTLNTWHQLFERKKIISYITIFLILGISLEVTRNYFSQISDNLRYNLKVRSKINNFTAERISLKRAVLNLMKGNNILGIAEESNGSALKNSRRYRLLDLLNRIDKDNSINKKETCIYIPKTNDVFWGMQTRVDGTPFIVPGLTSIAMIDGVPDYLNPTQRKLRGYHVYNKDFDKQEKNNYIELTIDELKKRAQEKGFSKIIKIEFNNNEFLIEKIEV